MQKTVLNMLSLSMFQKFLDAVPKTFLKRKIASIKIITLFQAFFLN